MWRREGRKEGVNVGLKELQNLKRILHQRMRYWFLDVRCGGWHKTKTVCLDLLPIRATTKDRTLAPSCDTHPQMNNRNIELATPYGVVSQSISQSANVVFPFSPHNAPHHHPVCHGAQIEIKKSICTARSHAFAKMITPRTSNEEHQPATASSKPNSRNLSVIECRYCFVDFYRMDLFRRFASSHKSHSPQQH